MDAIEVQIQPAVRRVVGHKFRLVGVDAIGPRQRISPNKEIARNPGHTSFGDSLRQFSQIIARKRRIASADKAKVPLQNAILYRPNRQHIGLKLIIRSKTV